MSKMRIVMLGLAAVSAIGAGVLAKGFLASNRQQAAQTNTVVVDQVEKEQVLVVTKDLLMGEKLGEAAIAWQDWPKSQVQPNMITKSNRAEALEELKDARARYAMYQGEIVVEKKVVLTGDKGFMSAILPKGMRAISVGVSDRTTAGGFILPNDRVDVIVTRKFSNQGSGNSEQVVKSQIALSNVRVLAINQTYRQEAEGETVTVAKGETATLELTSEQAEAIAKIESSGELSLALRSIAESDGKAIGDDKPVLAEAFVKGPGRKAEKGVTYIRSGLSSVAFPNP
jgi:pilus assembly protein CpaB